jgi:cytochrome c553
MESGDPTRSFEEGSERAKELRCGICHLSYYRGQNQIPRLAGQREAYLEAEMRAYRDGKRYGGDTIMAATLYGVSDADIKALAHYLSRSAPGARRLAGGGRLASPSARADVGQDAAVAVVVDLDRGVDAALDRDLGSPAVGGGDLQLELLLRAQALQAENVDGFVAL